MKLDPAIRDQILEIQPSLKAFAISLSGNVDRADDLVQETLLRAITHIDSFEPGTNLPAWLFTILRNLFRSEYRKRRREVEDADGAYAEGLKSHPEQHGVVEFEEFRQALQKLPTEQREALILVGASGFSYDDAAAICGCACGTIKSRVNRARSTLKRLLGVEGDEPFVEYRGEFGPPPVEFSVDRGQVNGKPQNMADRNGSHVNGRSGQVFQRRQGVPSVARPTQARLPVPVQKGQLNLDGINFRKHRTVDFGKGRIATVYTLD